jgi:hypothetical protein
MTDQEMNEAVARKLGGERRTLPDVELEDGTIIRHYPDYCHSIAAAWEITTFFEQHQIRFNLGFLPIMPPAQRWEIIWAGPQALPTDKVMTLYTSSAPKAICLAFLMLS